jgi:iron complex outermembrane receptor protein
MKSTQRAGICLQLVVGTAATACIGVCDARAQDAGNQLQEIVITAQKREQSLQDVPIAVTALKPEALQANRIQNVTDLSGFVPGLEARPSAGGTALPSFSMRGITSYGVVPGSDKEVSIYLDGVYISSATGSLFDLPDVERIEVLRGPQGTLFGRNSTAGAVSVITRDPTGELGGTESLTFGDHDEFRDRTSIDLPAWGPLSAYVTFVHEERTGDIQNTGAGTTWNRSGPATGLGTETSPQNLGDKDTKDVFIALKFAPNDDFTTRLKLDYGDNHFTPEGNALVAIAPNAPLVGSLLSSLINSTPNPPPNSPTNQRPNSVNNSWTTPGYQDNYGFSLTSDYRVSDGVSLKNILAYRHSYVESSSLLDGLGGLVFTPQALVPYATFAAFSSVPGLASAPPAVQAATIGAFARGLAPQIGNRFVLIGLMNEDESDQWSDEFQVNYESTLLNLTAGAIWFHDSDRSASPPGLPNQEAFAVLPANGDVPLGGQGTAYNHVQSWAAYAQAEVHVLKNLDVVLGGRETQDIKNGTYVEGGTFIPSSPGSRNGTFAGLQSLGFHYDKTKPNYSLGLNYNVEDNILLYGKYSTAFVSGGAIGPSTFAPETVASWELGAKATLLDRKLRTNLALWTAEYKNLQSAQSGENIGFPELGTVIADDGTLRAKGFEFEADAAPIRHVTVGGSLAYSTERYLDPNPAILASSFGVDSAHQLIPTWTSSMYAQYITDPVFQDAFVSMRLDATWHSPILMDPNPYIGQLFPSFAGTSYSPAQWMLNTRVALENITIGPTTGEIAFWVHNLNDSQAKQFQDRFVDWFVSASFVQARSFGADLIIKF